MNSRPRQEGWGPDLVLCSPLLPGHWSRERAVFWWCPWGGHTDSVATAGVDGAPMNVSHQPGARAWAPFSAESEAPNHSSISLGPCSSSKAPLTHSSHLMLICELLTLHSLAGPRQQYHIETSKQTRRIYFSLPFKSILFQNKKGKLE